MFKILYSSDLHGNLVQYKKLVEFANEHSIDAVIVGGDIAPKGLKHAEFISGQREFFEKDLPRFADELKAPLYILMGNDDIKANEDVFEKFHGEKYFAIHGKRLPLGKDFEIVGYGIVPITPFGIKDWEKYDLSSVPKSMATEYLMRKDSNYRLDGAVTMNGSWEPFRFDGSMEKEDSIQKDLEDEFFSRNARKTVYVIHTPPNKTHLDQVGPGVHVGSFAVREFIEREQPYVTLHGHIHETVAVSGEFMDTIGDTVSICSGNHNVGARLAVVVFDLHDYSSAQRLIL